MPKVYNWQLGRDMEYPYEDARPKKQIAWVFDLNKCIACQTCSVACKMTWSSGRGQEYMFWNNVENVDIIVSGSTAFAMGNYVFTDPDGNDTKVEYSFGYMLDDEGNVRITLHHSSLPYAG